MVHDFTHAQILLGEAGIARTVVEDMDEAAHRVRDEQRLATRRELAGIRADDEVGLAAARADGAGTECGGVGRNVEHAVRREHGAAGKGEVHPAAHFPAGNIDGVRRRVADADELLLLVAGRGVELDAVDDHIDIRGRGQRDTGVLGLVGADAQRGVGDAVFAVEMPAAGLDEIRDERVDAVGEVDAGVEIALPALGRPGPLGPVAVGFLGEFVAPGANHRFEHQLIGGRAGRLDPGVEQRADATEEHLARALGHEDRVIHAVETAGRAGKRLRLRRAVERERLVLIVGGLHAFNHGGVRALVENRAPREVHVEGDDAPFLRAEGVALQSHVRPHVVVLMHPAGEGHVVDDLRDVHQVHQVGQPAQRRIGFRDGGGQLLEIRVNRVAWNQLLEAARAGGRGPRGHLAARLVVGAFRVEAEERGQLIAVDVVMIGQLVELPVQL